MQLLGLRLPKIVIITIRSNWQQPCFSPSKVCELKPSSAAIDSLCKFTFLNSSFVIDGLKTELPQYLASAEGVSHEIDVIQMVEDSWAWTPLLVKSIQSLYCLCNHLLWHLKEFSLYWRTLFQHNKLDSSIEDYVQLWVMLQYNYRC